MVVFKNFKNFAISINISITNIEQTKNVNKECWCNFLINAKLIIVTIMKFKFIFRLIWYFINVPKTMTH